MQIRSRSDLNSEKHDRWIFFFFFLVQWTNSFPPILFPPLFFNDKLQGSVATYWRCSGVVNNQIRKGLLFSLLVNFLHR